MFIHITRARILTVWLSGLTVLACVVIALGLPVRMDLALLLFGCGVVPPSIILALWPGGALETASVELRRVEPR
ncbi:MAG: hypothetical protein AB7F99_00170 [Vicinamibacterales bacterium]